ncbi:mycothiol system anti-sigma-R factor [Corynebacterium sp. sy017]|uniref:mycothiol system anti-sigma-R factor n=1 Tax=unclassified Corynebacterium TaxID=2624378 RepID=UPI0011860CD6|nr:MULTISPECIES: mycothiol system anti-sigma-R factor [unclassified Corynebacterium]MBP3088747.1 mycothiol system anti-sigma-R factor [Corynebacterium sp. sy017]QDZ42140.1 mycothiol system anti-sigma-R factor [Corynebacterium sp. sy039]TSD92028.1 mycothiol system anti-sigma-R factor [Corynebacterium sp. SY003]
MSHDSSSRSSECSCSEVHVGMYALLDRELTPAECQRLEAHVAQCPECAQQIAAEVDLRQLLKKCCCQPAPESLKERISVSISTVSLRTEVIE